MTKHTKNTGSAFTRRGILKSAAATGALAVTGFPFIARAQASRITFPNSGGALEDAYKPAYYDTFKAATGIDVIGAPYMDTARVKAMVESNAVDVDLISTDAIEAATMGKMGLLEPIDYDIINRDDLIEGAANEFHVVNLLAALVMAWSTRNVTEESRPKNWAEYFDPEAKPGPRSLWRNAPQVLDIAAMGGGQPASSLYPLDLDRSFAALDKAKDDIVWWTSGAQSAQLLIDGEVDFGTAWNGRLFAPKRDGAQIDYTYDNALYTAEAIIIPKGAPNKKLSMEFLANMLKAENQAIFSKHIPYGPVNKNTFELLDAETLAILPNSPENAATGVQQDSAYWSENGPELIDRFNKWLVG